jgi:membrane peptidoglycan carboxypeptidase
MADAKPRKGRGLALGTSLLALVWLLGVWPPPVWWRDHWPRETAMMREAADVRATARPITLAQVSPSLVRMVIIGEDSRFRTHHGVDPT